MGVLENAEGCGRGAKGAAAPKLGWGGDENVGCVYGIDTIQYALSAIACKIHCFMSYSLEAPRYPETRFQTSQSHHPPSP